VDENPFGGFRLELLTGWDNAGVNFDDTFEDGRNSQDGFIYGVGAGYDFEFGSGVVGIETELLASTAGKSETFTSTFAPVVNPLVVNNITATTHTDAGGDYYIGVRGGLLVSPNMLLYAKAGYTHATIDMDVEGTVNGIPFDFDDGVTLDGIRLGVGGEVAFSKHWFGKIEYRYSNYNNGDLDIGNVDLDAAFGRMDVDRHQVVLGAGLRF
jgi:outer membrane immunogenic protein